MRASTGWLVMLGLAGAGGGLQACGDSGGGSGTTSAGGAAGAEAGTDAATESGQEAGSFAVGLPQAVGGAMLANSDVYAQVPVHVDVVGAAVAVQIDLAGEKVAATDDDGDGRWTAWVKLAGREDGSLSLTATAVGAGDETAEVAAELVVGARGAQLTNFDADGAAATPRVHRRGDEAWLTFTDRSAGPREAWLWKIDGAGRPVGDRVALVRSSEETHSARTAFGAQGIGVLYQQSGGPYTNRFLVADFDGNDVVASVDLDPAGAYGSFGGDVVFDGEAYVAVWRVNDGMGGGEVRWIRVVEATGEITGPVVVASSGPVDPPTAASPVGGFEPFSFVKVRVIAGTSFVTFVRGRYDALLDFEIPRSQVVLVSDDGVAGEPQYLGGANELHFHREHHVFEDGRGGGLLVLASSDLTSSETTPPTLLRGARISSAGRLEPSLSVMVDAPDDRGEPFFLPHQEHAGVLLWADHRTYAADLLTGRIQLTVAPVGPDLSVGQEVVFEHADPIANLAQIHGASAGTNVLFAWIDDIGGIADPRPEVYFDTAWF